MARVKLGEINELRENMLTEWFALIQQLKRKGCDRNDKAATQGPRLETTRKFSS